MIHAPLITPCPCGKVHTAQVKDVLTGAGAIRNLPDCVRRLNAGKPFLVSDLHTEAAAGTAVKKILAEAGIPFTEYVFHNEHFEPDETAVGSAAMHFDTSCDLILGIGSGVINDICKILSHISNHPYIIVATAPSMDGYASATSSMTRDGLKISLPSRCADIIIGDTDILKKAPLHMLSSGIGDMIAKYVSIAEWRISHLITGEYYCEQIAQLIRTALQKCVSQAEGLMKRDPSAVEAVFEGLIIGGLAMAYAGVSRPASGTEHYFSHIWDMRGIQFGTPVDLHGIQCGAATLTVVKLYESVQSMQPDAKKALSGVSGFDYEAWKKKLREFLGQSAEEMIALEAKEQKYSQRKHSVRLPVILDHWNEILQIIEVELPSARDLEKLLLLLQIPVDLNELGVDRDCAEMTFRASKDIRDKYVLARLAWDLGILDELAPCAGEP